MITADEIDALTFQIEKLYSDFTDSIINDIARRVGSLDYAKATAALQVQRLSESGMLYNQILERIGKLTGKSKAELRKMFKEAGVKTKTFDDNILQEAGLSPLALNLSPAMQNVLLAGLKKTEGTFENLTRTMPLAGQEAYMKATDLAYMQIVHGGMSYDEAIRRAVKQMAHEGIKVVTYAGHIDQIDVAIRRAALTGVSQTAGYVQMANMDELGVDLVEVSAHIGARPSHQLWQGKVYSLHGKHGKYEDFVTATGYGTGAGLMGWNCRHSFYPYFGDISQRNYNAKTLKEYQNETVRYNGEDVPFYDATQIQRGIERKIRYWKRQMEAVGSAGLDNGAEFAKVKEYQAKMRDFIDQTGIMRQRVREGFGVKRVVVPKPKPPLHVPPPKPEPTPIIPEEKVGGKTLAEWEKLFEEEKKHWYTTPEPFPTPKPPPTVKPTPTAKPIAPSALRPSTSKVGKEIVENSRIIPTNRLQYNDLYDAEQAGKVFNDKMVEKTAGWFKNDVVKGLQEDLAATARNPGKWDYRIINDLIHEWASTSNDTSNIALRMQRRASKLFGAKFSRWQTEKWLQVNNQISEYSKLTDDDLDDFLTAMYNRTQKWLKANNIKNVVVYRGIDISELAPETVIEIAKISRTPDALIRIDSNAMSSWSTSSQVAHNFSGLSQGIVLKVAVPAERIIGSFITGYGCAAELETVVLGGAEDWGTIVKISMSHNKLNGWSWDEFHLLEQAMGWYQ